MTEQLTRYKNNGALKQVIQERVYNYTNVVPGVPTEATVEGVETDGSEGYILDLAGAGAWTLFAWVSTNINGTNTNGTDSIFLDIQRMVLDPLQGLTLGDQLDATKWLLENGKLWRKVSSEIQFPSTTLVSGGDDSRLKPNSEALIGLDDDFLIHGLRVAPSVSVSSQATYDINVHVLILGA